GVVIESLRPGFFQIDNGNCPGVFIADKKKSVIGSDVDVNAAGEISVADIAEDWIAFAGSHAHHIHKHDVFTIGHNQKLAVMGQNHSGWFCFYREYFLQSDLTFTSAEQRNAVSRARI